MRKNKRQIPIPMIVHLFGQPEEDWLPEYARNVLPRLKDFVARARDVSSVLFVSDSAAVLKEAGKIGVDTFLFEPGPLPEHIPERMAALMNGLLDKGVVPDIPVLAISGRSPLLTTESIEKAVRLFHENDSRIVISCVPPRDHPCQLRAHFTINQVGTLFPVNSGKNNGQAPDWVAGCPFDYDWESDLLSLQRMLKPLEPILRHGAKNGLKVAWTRSAPDRATFLLRKKSLLGDRNPRLIGFDPTCENVAIQIEDDPDGRSVIRLPQSSSGLSDRRNISISSVGANRLETINTDLHGNRPATTERLPAPGEGELSFTLREHVESGPYDISEHFEPDENSWSYEKVTKRPLDSAGQLIQGRQVFPVVFRLTEHLVLGRAGKLTRLGEAMESGAVAGMVIAESEDVIVGNEFDFLHAEIMTRTLEEVLP